MGNLFVYFCSANTNIILSYLCQIIKKKGERLLIQHEIYQMLYNRQKEIEQIYYSYYSLGLLLFY